VTQRWLLALALSWIGVAHAEQYVQDGEFVVHYAAVPTVMLAAEVAQQFGIARNPRFALLMLNAQRGTVQKNISVPADGEGEARNLVGHKQPLRLRRAQEGDVHYLLAEVEALNGEVLIFKLSVTPQGATRPLEIKFQQQFYSE
jgi:hypothetical protein